MDHSHSISLSLALSAVLDEFGDLKTAQLITQGLAIHKDEQHQLIHTLRDPKHSKNTETKQTHSSTQSSRVPLS